MSEQDAEHKARQQVRDCLAVYRACGENGHDGKSLQDFKNEMTDCIMNLIQQAEQRGYLKEVLLQIDLEERRNKLAFQKGVLRTLNIIKECITKNKLTDPTLDLIVEAIHKGGEND